MRHVVYTCTRCGVEARADYGPTEKVDGWRVITLTDTAINPGMSVRFELCEPCNRAHNAFLAGLAVLRKTPPQPEPPTAPRDARGAREWEVGLTEGCRRPNSFACGEGCVCGGTG